MGIRALALKPETKFKNKIRPHLEALPRTWIVKTSERSVRGIPDFILCVNTFFIAIELKVDSGVDRLQEYNLARILACGGVSFITTPKTWRKDYEFLKEIAQLSIQSYRLTITTRQE